MRYRLTPIKVKDLHNLIPLEIVMEWMYAPSRIFFIRRDHGYHLRVRKIIGHDPYHEFMKKKVN